MVTEITRSDILNLIKALDDLPNSNAQLPSRFYYILSKNRGKLNSLGQSIEDTINNSIFKKYAVDNEKKDPKTNEVIKGKNGKPVIEQRVPPESVDDYQRDIKDLLRETEEIDFHQIQFSTIEPDMPKIQGVSGIYLIFQYLCSDDDPTKKGQTMAAAAKAEEAEKEKKEPAVKEIEQSA